MGWEAWKEQTPDRHRRRHLQVHLAREQAGGPGRPAGPQPLPRTGHRDRHLRLPGARRVRGARSLATPRGPPGDRAESAGCCSRGSPPRSSSTSCPPSWNGTGTCPDPPCSSSSSPASPPSSPARRIGRRPTPEARSPGEKVTNRRAILAPVRVIGYRVERGDCGDHRRRALIDALHVDLGRGDHRRSVFLAGSGRSGTTWLSSDDQPPKRLPLRLRALLPGQGADGRALPAQAVPETGRHARGVPGACRAVLTGGLRSLWSDRFNRRLVARRRLIKDIRANLLLGWMHENFPGMPIVLLLRHPCAVVTSRLALGWNDFLAQTMEQEDLVEDFLLPMEADIRAARGDFERHLFAWCVENHVPLTPVRARGDPPGLLREPPRATRTRAGTSVFVPRRGSRRTRLPRARAPLAPEPRDRVRSPSTAGGASWTGTGCERAIEILGLFWLDRVYGEGPMPDPSAAQALLAGRARDPPEAGHRWWCSRASDGTSLWQRHQTLATLFARAGYPTVFVETTGIANPAASRIHAPQGRVADPARRGRTTPPVRRASPSTRRSRSRRPSGSFAG